MTTLLGLERGREGVPAAAAAERGRRDAGRACLHLAAAGGASGTDLASPELLGESIRHHLQARKKLRLDHAVERISARKPTGEEAGAAPGGGGRAGAERDRHRL